MQQQLVIGLDVQFVVVTKLEFCWQSVFVNFKVRHSQANTRLRSLKMTILKPHTERLYQSGYRYFFFTAPVVHLDKFHS